MTTNKIKITFYYLTVSAGPESGYSLFGLSSEGLPSCSPHTDWGGGLLGGQAGNMLLSSSR